MRSAMGRVVTYVRRIIRNGTQVRLGKHHVGLTNCVSQTQKPQRRSLLQACPLPFVTVRGILPSRGGQIPGTSCGSTSWTRSTGIPVLVRRPLDYVTKLVSGLLACELPLDGNPVAIHPTIPGPSLLAQASDISDSAFA